MASTSNNHNTATAAPPADVIARPIITEAQLRWSQFHHKRRAVQVRASLKTFYESPVSLEQVEGALSEDAKSSSCSESLREIRQKRPAVSKGRRALLRVSKRKYEERRQAIVEHGFQGTMNNDEDEDDATSNKEAELEDALNEIFFMTSKRRRRKRHHRRRDGQEDSSFQRFQAACQAVMMNLAAPPKHSIAIPTRKWTRTVDSSSNLFQDYLDEWGMMRGPRHHAHHIEEFAAAAAPMDRGASWMMHLPAKATSIARDNPYYHDPSLALPPSAGSNFQHEDDGDETHSVASTLALQAPGAQKFSRLVALVQQRMIEQMQQQQLKQAQAAATSAFARPTSQRVVASPEGRPVVHDQEGEEHEGNDIEIVATWHTSTGAVGGEFHTRHHSSLAASPFSPPQAPVRERKTHYVPRMRLRDFLPEGTTEQEVQELERSLQDGKGIPPTMKLRGLLFPTEEGDSSSPGRRRASPAQELASAFEKKPDPTRRLSKTRQMAQSLEGHIPKYHPKMRLRSNFEYHNQEGEEKKLSEDGAVIGRLDPSFSERFDAPMDEQQAEFLELQRPIRQTHALAGNFSGTRSGSAADKVEGLSQRGRTRKEDGLTGVLEDMAPPDVGIVSSSSHEEQLQEPPRRKQHPLSDRFVQAMQASQQPPTKESMVIRPLPPGTCCTRCAKESPLAAASLGGHGSFFSGDNNNTLEAQILKISAGSMNRVSEVFSQLRQGNGDDDRRESIATVVTKSSTGGGSQRVSDFFAKVRQFHPRATTDEQDPGTTSAADNKEAPLEDTDFFAQVREMIATSDDDEESASQRVSDFFAQVRQMEEEIEQEKADHCMLCEDCQVQDIEDRVESASVSLSPEHGTTPVSNRSRETLSTKTIDEDAKSEARSDHSALSSVWNRGRSSLSQFATNLNAITEKTLAANPQIRKSASSMPGRVGGFLQILQGKKDQEQQQPHAEPAQLSTEAQDAPEEVAATPRRQELEYNSENDLEAMAAYRKSQEYKRQLGIQDDASSHSSFQVLPEGIREVVKRQSSPPKPPRVVPSASEAQNDNKVKEIMPPQSYFASPTSSPRRAIPDPEGSVGSDPKGALTRPSVDSPSQMNFTGTNMENLSPEKYREAHDKVMQNSPLLGSIEQGIIDTDGTTSDASDSAMGPHRLASLMLSPDVLQKRLHQAVRAVEGQHWDQVKYLLNANPWLAEMCELTSNQYLLHKISFFGFSAPKELCAHLIEMFPSAVYKFDRDGNVPLHLAAAAGHLKMIRMLGEKFESGASIRNEDGMLPLHFTIASYADFEGSYSYDSKDDDHPSPLQVIKTVLKFFPQAVAIGDNDGNLPIHIAAECLHGGLGVDVIYILLDEADRQLQDPCGVRFHNKVKLEDIVNEDISGGTIPADGEIDTSVVDEDIHCSTVKNDFGETPLLAAVRSRRGWDVIEALVSGPGGHAAALCEDSEKNTVLHLLVGQYQDPAAAMSILKIVPQTATMRNNEGMLPIEVACLQLMPEEIILAIALVDLPFDIDDKDSLQLRENFGSSWWFLVCECDDHYVDIVQQIVMICSFRQVHALCSFKGGSRRHKDTVISRATPKCKRVLAHEMRFLGRFELVDNTPVKRDPALGLKVFDALDFADTEGDEEPRRVTLKCYSNIEPFRQATAMRRDFPLDPIYVEEIWMFGDDGGMAQGPQEFCIAIECPQLTLDRVVDGMTKKGGYVYDTELRKKYAAKMCAVLRLIAKAIRHLHESGVIHGNICMQTCGKFEQSWKLLDTLRAQRIGDFVNKSRYGQSFPPEVLDLDDDDGAVYDSDNAAVSFLSAKAAVSIDIWAFGKLAYETLVGKPLVEFDPSKKPAEDTVALLEILEWDQPNMKAIFSNLLDSGVTDSCAELVTSCLFPRPDDRPSSMHVILEDPFWKDMRQHRERSSPSKRSRGEVSSTVSPKSIFTETASVATMQEVETAEI